MQTRAAASSAVRLVVASGHVGYHGKMTRPNQAAPTVCVRAVRACVLVGTASGLDLRPILDAHGVGHEVLVDPYARVPHALVADLWTQVPARLGDDAFGLHAAEASIDVAFDVLDHAIQHCASVRETFARLARFVRLLHDAATATMVLCGDRVRYSHRVDCEPAMPRQLCEFIVARWVLILRRRCGAALPLLGIYLPFPAPADLREHRRVLDLPLCFSAPDLALEFHRHLLDQAPTGANLALGDVMNRHVEDLLASQPSRPDPVLPSARRLVAMRLPDGPPSLDQVARGLGLSRRSLQRRLADEGSSFQLLVDETRRELALRHLRDPRVSLTDVALLTGFADASAFHHAFRRWTGTTPREHRRAVGAH